MRSRLEARFAAFLDRAGFQWTYEPRAFASERGQYLPDFLVVGAGISADMYVEVKGEEPSEESRVGLIDRMEIICESEPDASLAIVIGARSDDRVFTFPVMSARDIGWTSGCLGLCGAGEIAFCCLPARWNPIPLCAHAEFTAYVNPFRQP